MRLERWAGTCLAGLYGPLEGFGIYPKLSGKPLKGINGEAVIVKTVDRRRQG